MVDLVFSPEQIRSAPPDVKKWIKSVLFAELALPPVLQEEPEEIRETALAECSVSEAGLVLEQIRDDYLACQVLFELSRDSPHDNVAPQGMHRIALEDILRHTRLGDPEHLVGCLNRIGEAFQSVRRDPAAMLFAFDRIGGLYIHDTTRRSIKSLWQALVTSRLMNTSNLPGMAAPAGPVVPLDSDTLPSYGDAPAETHR